MLQKTHQFKPKDSEIKDFTLCLGNILKDFAINNVKKTGLKGSVIFFSVDFNGVDTNNVFHRYLMKRTVYNNAWVN